MSNLTVACEDCNQSKNNLTAAEFGHPNIQKQALRPLKDAATVNATRYAIGAALRTLGLPVSFWSGGRTKFNRTLQCYPKAHWIDAACVGESGNQVKLDLRMQVRQVRLQGTGLVRCVGWTGSDSHGLRLKQLVRLRVLGLATWFSR